MVNGGQHRAGGEPRDVVRVGRGERVLIDHRRAATPADDAGNVLSGVDAHQVLVGGRSRFQHRAAGLAEPRGYGLERFGTLGAFRMSRRRDVIDESRRTDEN